ncbi:MAG: MFS transporter [Alphaproteobacteria bacterium]|nr:MFS transporter [Alphaproteobacteria bacterium]
MRTSPAAPAHALPPYLFGLGSWFVALGIGMVMVQWIVAEMLHQPVARMGVVQMCAMGPSILFMLWGGTVADHCDTRRQLLICHGLAALPSFGLAVLAAAGELHFGAMIVYALASGTISAFAIPARDGLLPRVTSLSLPKAVAMATGAQYLCQLIGIALATTADTIGAVPLLATQAAVMLAGGIAVWRLAPQPPVPRADDAPKGWAALWDGVRVARSSPQIWPVLALLFSVGLFFGATFVVVIPIAVRDVYGGGSVRLALVNFVFWTGIIASSFALMRLGTTVARRGRAIIMALSWGVLVLLTISLLPPFPVLLLLVFCWGAGAGVTMTQGRTIVQVATPASHRSRLLALFQLGFMGGTPIGAPIIGWIAYGWSLTGAIWLACGGAVVTLALIVTVSRIWRQELRSAPA